MVRRKNTGDKPYNRCLVCEVRGEKCDGPRTSSMTLERWCEFMRDMKELVGLSNQYISEKSGVSIKTVERLMAGRVEQDIMRETARMIEDVIIGSSSQYPCYAAFVEQSQGADGKQLVEAQRDLERALANNKDYQDALDTIHASYTSEMATIRAEAQLKVDHLLRQIEYLRLENDRKAAIIEKLLR